MSEIKQLEKRIIDSDFDGISTKIIRDDYSPVGDMMIKTLVDGGNFVTMREIKGSLATGEWKVWAKAYEPKFFNGSVSNE